MGAHRSVAWESSYSRLMMPATLLSGATRLNAIRTCKVQARTGCWHHTTHILVVPLTLKSCLSWQLDIEAHRGPLAGAYQPTRVGAGVRKVAHKKGSHCQGPGPSPNLLAHGLKSMAHGLRRKENTLPSFSLFGFICHLRFSQPNKNAPWELERLLPTRLVPLPGD